MIDEIMEREEFKDLKLTKTNKVFHHLTIYHNVDDVYLVKECFDEPKNKFYYKVTNLKEIIHIYASGKKLKFDDEHQRIKG